MEENSETRNEDNASSDSLETPNAVVEPSEPSVDSTAAGSSSVEPEPIIATPPDSGSTSSSPKSSKPAKHRLLKRFRRINIYALALVLLIVIAVVIAAAGYFQTKDKSANNNISSQNLSQSALNQLANSNATVGDANQTLTVQSNAVFNGQVLLRGNLQVAGKLQLGNTLSVTGITVSGDSILQGLQVAKNLAVTGDTALDGQLTVQKNITSNGNGTFNGTLSATQVTASSLQLNGDLVLTHHISAGGVTPSRSNGPALGAGGTVSISGSDTAGSITINTGSAPSAGCFITVNFATKFNSTPHVIISPVGSGAAALQYYVNRSTSNFSVCADNAPSASETFGYDYMVLD